MKKILYHAIYASSLFPIHLNDKLDGSPPGKSGVDFAPDEWHSLFHHLNH